MLLICVNAGALQQLDSTGIFRPEDDRVVLLEEAVWESAEYPYAFAGAGDTGARASPATVTQTVDDKTIVDWIFEQDTTIVV